MNFITNLQVRASNFISDLFDSPQEAYFPVLVERVYGSFIQVAVYDPNTMTMRLTFKNGSMSDFQGVTDEEFEDLVDFKSNANEVFREIRDRVGFTLVTDSQETSYLTRMD